MTEFYIFSYKNLLSKLCYAKCEDKPETYGGDKSFKQKVVDKKLITEEQFNSLSIEQLTTM